jgi:hypothetical protein
VNDNQKVACLCHSDTDLPHLTIIPPIIGIGQHRSLENLLG